MLDLALFKYPRFVGVQLLPIATCYAYVVLLIVLPLRFIGVEGLSEISAGTLMLALSAPMLVVPSLAVALTRWVPAGVIAGIGLLVAAGGLLILGREASDPGMHSALAMFIIGLGAGLPWGLMDGLSVSVVPKERAGMASGIFNTTKVAGEGVALAIVSALLASLMAGALQNHASVQTLAGRDLREAAQRLATGDLARAAAFFPSDLRGMLTQSYATAFQTLTYVLAAITIVSALIAFVLLGRTQIESGDSDSSAFDGALRESEGRDLLDCA